MGRFLDACGATGPLELDVLDEAGGLVSRWSFAQPFAVVGRDPKSDLALEGELVSTRHAYLQIIEGRVFCVDLGSRSGLYWGGESRPAGWLSPGESIGVGSYRLRLVGPVREPPRLPWPNPMAVARLPGGVPLSRVTLKFPDVVPEPARWRPRRVLALVGRSSRCHLRVPDEAVSLFHCALIRTTRGVWMVDLLSREGTRINGALARSGRLDDGDTMHVARYRVLVAEDESSGATGEAPASSREPAEIEEATAPPTADRVALTAAPFPLPSFSEIAATAPPLPSVRQTLAGHPPEQIAVVESVVEPIIAQFGQMQQQMFEQFHQAMMMMFQMFSSMHRDQMNLVREELDQIRKISSELEDLRTAAAKAPPAPSSSPPSPKPPPTTAPRGPASLGTHPPVKPPHVINGISERTPAETTRRVRAEAPRPTTPNPQAPAAPPAQGQVHDLLFQRMASLQEERQTRWRKILSMVTGGAGTDPPR